MSVNSKMTALADAIRDKSGRIDALTIDEMTTAVQSIETGADTSDATAMADEIFAGETAYGANGKITGTFTIEEELIEQNDLISQIATLVTTKANPQGGTDTSDATATAGDILSGKTAYVKGGKVTGTYEDVTTEINTYTAKLALLETAITALETELQGKAGGGSGGGSIETANITLINNNRFDDYYVYGAWVDNSYISSYSTDVYCEDSKIKTTVKGSYITLDNTLTISITGSYSNVGFLGSAHLISIDGDCTITFE